MDNKHNTGGVLFPTKCIYLCRLLVYEHNFQETGFRKSYVDSTQDVFLLKMKQWLPGVVKSRPELRQTSVCQGVPLFSIVQS